MPAYTIDRDTLYSLVQSIGRSGLEELLNGLLASGQLLGHAARTPANEPVERVVLVDADEPEIDEAMDALHRTLCEIIHRRP
jgi:hypothetical protein